VLCAVCCLLWVLRVLCVLGGACYAVGWCMAVKLHMEDGAIGSLVGAWFS